MSDLVTDSGPPTPNLVVPKRLQIHSGVLELCQYTPAPTGSHSHTRPARFHDMCTLISHTTHAHSKNLRPLLRTLRGQPISSPDLSSQGAKGRLDAVLTYLIDNAISKRHEHYFYHPGSRLLHECAAMASTPYIELVPWPQALLSASVKVSSEYQPSEPLSGVMPHPAYGPAGLAASADQDPTLLLSLQERRKLAPRTTGEWL